MLRDSRYGIGRFPIHFSILDLRTFLYLGDHYLPLPLLSVSMGNGAIPTFVQFVLTQELHTFITSKRFDWVARAAVEVLERIKEAGVDKEEWPRQLREASGFVGDDCEPSKAISAYEAAHAQKMYIKSGEFRTALDGGGPLRRDLMEHVSEFAFCL